MTKKQAASKKLTVKDDIVEGVTTPEVATEVTAEAVAAEQTKPQGKPVVKYRSVGYKIEVGQCALVTPLDHPNVTLNGNTALTSTVVSYDEDTGSFETKNTKYVKEQA